MSFSEDRLDLNVKAQICTDGNTYFDGDLYNPNTGREGPGMEEYDGTVTTKAGFFSSLDHLAGGIRQVLDDEFKVLDPDSRSRIRIFLRNDRGDGYDFEGVKYSPRPLDNLELAELRSHLDSAMSNPYEII